MRSKIFVQCWRWGLLVALILLWEAGSRVGFIDPFFFSSPSEIVRTAIVKWQSGQLPRDIAYTAASTLLGFLLGTVIGSIVGLMFWFSRPVALVAEPWLIVLNALPKLARAPVLDTLLISLGAKRRQIFTRLVVPSAMPSIITGLRVNIALSMAGSIVGEFIASDRGLGRMIVYAGTIFDLPLVWVGVVVLSIVSIAMYAGVVLLEKLLLRRWTTAR